MRHANTRPRRGAALIETIIALVVLAFTGAGMVSLLSQTLMSVHDVHEREVETADAARLLGAVASLSRRELLDRLGVTREPTLWLEVQQPKAALFDVVVRDTLRRADLLRTTVYRPDTVP